MSFFNKERLKFNLHCDHICRKEFRKEYGNQIKSKWGENQYSVMICDGFLNYKLKTVAYYNKRN